LAVFEKARQKFPAAKPVIFTSLDEQLFAAFGGDRVKSMMASMGGGPDEMIEHNLVKASVVKAQQKVEEGIITELKAQSDEEWFRKNYKKAL
jgi:preprotein translocase subunit SecA